MKQRDLKYTVFATVAAFVLVGCASSGDPDPPEPTEPTVTQSTPDSPAPTQTTETASPQETPTATGGPGASNEEDDVDEQDGVRTNSFNAVPDELGEMSVTSSETNPTEHRAVLDYMAADEQSRMVLQAYLPSNENDGTRPSQAMQMRLSAAQWTAANAFLKQKDSKSSHAQQPPMSTSGSALKLRTRKTGRSTIASARPANTVV